MSVNRIGFIGLGIMGRPMAKNLLKAKFSLCLYARHETSLHPFNDDNVKIFNSPKELARHCEIIITVVSDTPDVVEIATGNHGLIHGANTGNIIIDMSTISPEVTREIANKFSKKDINMIDAPMSGGEKGAIEGNLSIMVGGKKNVFKKALPVLKCLGKNITHVGDHGAGQVAKACNQILVAQTMSAVAEAFQLANSSGIDPSKVREALLGGFAYSKILDVHGKRMLDNDYRPGFKASLHHKDIKIALSSANKNNFHMPGTELVANYLEKIVDNGDGELDSAAIATLIFNESN